MLGGLRPPRTASKFEYPRELFGISLGVPWKSPGGALGVPNNVHGLPKESPKIITFLEDVAARLQDMTKALSCEVVLSQDILKTGAMPAGDLPQAEVPIRGRVEPLVVYTVTKAGMLSALTADFAVAAA